MTDGSVVYTVQASTTDGCTATSLPVEIAFQRCLYIPNAFTPNGDSNNDTFGPIIPGGGATVPTFMVFSRWGKKVFESSDNSLWDGKIDGKEAPVECVRLVCCHPLQRRTRGNPERRSDANQVTRIARISQIDADFLTRIARIF